MRDGSSRPRPSTRSTGAPHTRIPRACWSRSRASTRRDDNSPRSRACRPVCSAFPPVVHSTRAARWRSRSVAPTNPRSTSSTRPDRAGAAHATSGRSASVSTTHSTAYSEREPILREPILQVRDLVKHFPLTQGILFKRQIGAVKAVDGVSFDLHKGETLGIVGESGCGKSTLAKLLMNLERATSGHVTINGRDIAKAKGAELKRMRRNVQMVMQDPYT